MIEESPDPLAAIRAVIDQLNAAPPPRTEPIKLTRAQFDRLRGTVPSSPAPAAPLLGVPIVLVDTTTESTPYAEGWIKCPACGEPANDHGAASCDMVLMFGPWGDFAVHSMPVDPGFKASFERGGLDAMIDPELARRPTSTFPGLTFGDLERMRYRLACLAAVEEEQLREAIARWEDDGGR